MAIRMHDIRKAVLEASGLQYRDQNYYKLPGGFSTHPNWIKVFSLDDRGVGHTYKVKVLSSAEAKASSKTKATNPHRILIWCEEHKRWVFAGKFVQHVKMTHKKETK